MTKLTPEQLRIQTRLERFESTRHMLVAIGRGLGIVFRWLIAFAFGYLVASALKH